MECPRCGGNVTVFELNGAVSQVCEDCSYVGVVADHRPETVAIESWDDALSRFQTVFPDALPDGIARVDDDTTPPKTLADDDTSTADGEFQFRGTPESTTVTQAEPAVDVEGSADRSPPETLERSDATVVAVPDPDASDGDGETAGQPEDGGGETAGQPEDDSGDTATTAGDGESKSDGTGENGDEDTESDAAETA